MRQAGPNFLIDIADRLQAGPEDRAAGWDRIRGVADSLGLTGMNAGAAFAGSLEPVWTRFHMDCHWEEEYSQEALWTADPIWRWLPRPEPRLLKSSDGIAASENGGALSSAMRARDFNFVQVYKWRRAGLIEVLTLGTRAPADISLGPEIAAQMPVIASMMGGQLSAPPSSDGFLGIRYSPLSGRERAVLAYLASGLDNGGIAERMGLAEVTVRFHLKNARIKMGAATREQALAMAMARGMLDL
ncbi:helix-turn-helix transcriptional regulator [Mangrovicoccus ximenensis]|uniref:helix-turn-helix transcriptional regulator n=1 Tax=Mangrovicoccus ximenensis TaxID=1911570 RepID=UPI000D3A4BCE|nr:helix-turn-helix transcriptional regulator [Mangrovicoccus ximenensis]